MSYEMKSVTTTPTFDSWVTCSRANQQARLRLFCFPYAGGGASTFRTWSNDLPSRIQVCAVQLPGRQSRLIEPPFIRLSLLVQTLAPVLRPYFNVPFAFFGHSMGALISFELARHLRRQNSPGPAHLFVSSRRAPHIASSEPPIYALPESLFMAELHRLSGMSKEVLQNAELMQLVLPMLRADFALCETYVYSTEGPLDCPISAFGGLQDCEVSRDDLIAWRDQTRSSFTLRMFPGNHFFLDNARALLLQAVSQDLTQLLNGL
jgi:medium-chain acyl-[acyl-carrier-protein] hydrolase